MLWVSWAIVDRLATMERAMTLRMLDIGSV
jgi:hypothetical protein